MQGTWGGGWIYEMSVDDDDDDSDDDDDDDVDFRLPFRVRSLCAYDTSSFLAYGHKLSVCT
jgi:hypothetical protein